LRRAHAVRRESPTHRDAPADAREPGGALSRRLTASAARTPGIMPTIGSTLSELPKNRDKAYAIPTISIRTFHSLSRGNFPNSEKIVEPARRRSVPTRHVARSCFSISVKQSARIVASSCWNSRRACSGGMFRANRIEVECCAQDARWTDPISGIDIAAFLRDG
jgi:hypothetical protein